MELKHHRIVAGLLALCALLGVAIIVEDIMLGPPKRFLWADRDIHAPISHAYALIAFIVIDIILAGLLIFKGHALIRPVLAWSALQVLAMLLDPFTAPYYKVDPQQFAQYLFGIVWFDLLLVGRIATAVACWRAGKAG